MLRSFLCFTIFACLTVFTLGAPAPQPEPVPAGQMASAATYLILKADIAQLASDTPGETPEEFNFTVVGDWAGAAPVECWTRWNAEIANVTNVGDREVNVKSPLAFTCTDSGLSVDMTRIRVEPWFLWQLSLQANGFSSAIWRMKNMYETTGWTAHNVSTSQWHFDGGQGHPINGSPSGSLSECLREHTCISN